MTLGKRWRNLDRGTVARAPQRYGVYELGDDEGTVLRVDAGVLRDELKDALAYEDAAKVRWEVTNSADHAERLLEELR